MSKQRNLQLQRSRSAQRGIIAVGTASALGTAAALGIASVAASAATTASSTSSQQSSHRVDLGRTLTQRSTRTYQQPSTPLVVQGSGGGSSALSSGS